MELYRWGKEKIRIRLDRGEIASLHLEEDPTKDLDSQAKATLQGVVDLAREEYGLSGDLLVEIFPGKGGLVLQIGAFAEDVVFAVKDTDGMLSVYPLAKKLGGHIWQRRDGGGYYLAVSSPRKALPFTEFAKRVPLRESQVKSRCKRIL